MARKPDLARRREIAARAFEVIRERGVHRTSMSDIAAALEMKRPTLYWYFKDIGSIFEAVLDDNQASLEAYVVGRLAGYGHPLDVLEQLVRAALDYYEERQGSIIVLFQLWAVAASSEPERVLEQGRQFLGAARSRLVALVRAGINQKLVAPCNAEGLVDLVLVTVDGAMVRRVMTNDEVSSIVDGLCEHVLAPLRRSPTGDVEEGA